MKMRFLFFLIFALSASVIHAQNNDTCEIIRSTYDRIVASKFIHALIINRVDKIEMDPEGTPASTLKKRVTGKTWKRALVAFKVTSQISKMTCFDKDLIIGDDSISSFLKDNRHVKINTDTPFVKYINTRQEEIAQIEDLDLRMKRLNDLTLTKEFKKYRLLLDYNTPRLIQFSQPVFVDQFCFISIKIIKNTSSDSFGYLCLFKKTKNKWILIERVLEIK